MFSHLQSFLELVSSQGLRKYLYRKSQPTVSIPRPPFLQRMKKKLQEEGIHFSSRMPLTGPSS